MTKRIDESELLRLYVAEKRTHRDVAKLLGISGGTVYNRLKKLGIHRRDISEAKKGKPLPAAVLEARVRSGRDYILPGRPVVGAMRDSNGYVRVIRRDHPDADVNGYVLEHRLIMEEHIGRRLRDDEQVHHLNHHRSDNRLENLKLMSRSEHATHHGRERYVLYGGLRRPQHRKSP